MQDKNMDELFRSKLDAFEIEPSAGVWPRIAAEIDINKRQKAWAPYLGAAASVIILLTAGIFYIPQKEKQRSKQRVLNTGVRTAISRPVTKSEPILTATTTFAALKTIARGKKSHAVGAERINPATEAPDTGKTGGHAIALATSDEHQVTDPVVPGTTTQLAVKQVVAVAPGFITHSAITPVRLPIIAEQSDEPIKAGHKIRTLGGLINAVVARVDKRPDKIIEFTDNDDETNVTGINLGIIKIKKEK